MSRNTLSKIENGSYTDYRVSDLADLCAIFNCEIGYLLCEPGYRNRTREKTDICNALGISEAAVSTIQNWEQDYKDMHIFPVDYLVDGSW